LSNKPWSKRFNRDPTSARGRYSLLGTRTRIRN